MSTTVKDEKMYLRMNLNERIQHFLLLSSFITLVITGFGLVYPESFWVRWIVSIVGENAFELRGDIHRVAAVVMIFAGVYHIFYILFTKRGKKLFKDMLPVKKDLSDLGKSLKYFLSKSKEKPKYGRFSYVEKMEYWAVFWGTVIMGATGLILWFENFFLPVVNVAGMDIATAIHYYEAILASLAIVVWHFYYVFLNPDVFPMNKAWLTGYISRKIMEEEHPLELEELEKKDKGSKENLMENEE